MNKDIAIRVLEKVLVASIFVGAFFFDNIFCLNVFKFIVVSSAVVSVFIMCCGIQNIAERCVSYEQQEKENLPYCADKIYNLTITLALASLGQFFLAVCFLFTGVVEEAVEKERKRVRAGL